MKKSLLLVFCISFLGIYLSSCGLAKSFGCRNKEKLNIFNWGEYISKDVLEKFEKEYNVCVNYRTFLDNETAITKMQTQKYDLIFPSDYAIEQMAENNLIKEIDWEKVAGFNKEADLADDLVVILNNLKADNGFDLLKYGVPYFWGSAGLVYNKDKIDRAELESKNWEILKDTSKKVSFYDSSRDAFMIGEKALGYSMNTTNLNEINAAGDWLRDLKSKHGKNMAILTDEILDRMKALTYDIAVCYSGDAIFLMQENEKLDYYKPNGTNVWVDGMVIPKNCENEDLAYKFISFILEYDNALDNTIEVGYAAVNKKVYDEVVLADGAYHDIKNSYMVQVGEKDEVFRYLGQDVTKHINNEWLKILVG